MREIVNPQREKIEDLLAALERFEELCRRYRQRRGPDGKLKTIPEDILMSALEVMCPEDLEKHLQLSRARLPDYETLRQEIVLYAEVRTGKKAQRQGKRNNDPDAMDVDVMES